LLFFLAISLTIGFPSLVVGGFGWDVCNVANAQFNKQYSKEYRIGTKPFPILVVCQIFLDNLFCFFLIFAVSGDFCQRTWSLELGFDMVSFKFEIES